MQTKSNITTVFDFNVGAKVSLDLTEYKNLVCLKILNQIASLHSVNTWLELTTFRKTGPSHIIVFKSQR